MVDEFACGGLTDAPVPNVEPLPNVFGITGAVTGAPADPAVLPGLNGPVFCGAAELELLNLPPRDAGTNPGS